jgi:hypothetical protein
VRVGLAPEGAQNPRWIFLEQMVCLCFSNFVLFVQLGRVYPKAISTDV